MYSIIGTGLGSGGGGSSNQTASQEEVDKKFIYTRSVEDLRTMIRNGLVKDVNSPRNKDWYNETALMAQCRHQRIDGARYLLEECRPLADPNLTSTSGWTALHYAIFNNNGDSPDIVRLLLDHGADRSIKGKDNKTALMLATELNYSTIVSSLEKYFPDVDAKRRAREQSERLRMQKEVENEVAKNEEATKLARAKAEQEKQRDIVANRIAALGLGFDKDACSRALLSVNDNEEAAVKVLTINRERAEKERLLEISRQAHIQAERERIQREQAERQKISNEKADRERIAREKAEKEKQIEKERRAREQALKEFSIEKLAKEKEFVAKKGVLLKLKKSSLFSFGSSWEERFVYCDDETIHQYHESVFIRPEERSRFKPVFSASLKNCKVDRAPLQLRQYAFVITYNSPPSRSNSSGNSSEYASSLSTSTSTSLTLAAKDEITYNTWMAHFEKLSIIASSSAGIVSTKTNNPNNTISSSNISNSSNSSSGRSSSNSSVSFNSNSKDSRGSNIIRSSKNDNNITTTTATTTTTAANDTTADISINSSTSSKNDSSSDIKSSNNYITSDATEQNIKMQGKYEEVKNEKEVVEDEARKAAARKEKAIRRENASKRQGDLALETNCSNTSSILIGNSMSLKDYSQLRVDVDALLQDRQSLNSWLESLDRAMHTLVNMSEECPRLVWFYSKDPSRKDWLLDPLKFLMSDCLMLVFVCPVTLKVVKCGPKGDGWEVRNPKEWVKKWGPAILVSLKVLNVAMTVGRVLGLPLPSISIDNKLISSSLDKLAGAFTSTLRESAYCDVNSSIVSKDIERLSGDAYREIQSFLTTGDNASLGPLHLQLDPHMFRCKGEDGLVEWVSGEGRQAWEDMHRRQQHQNSSNSSNSISDAGKINPQQQCYTSVARTTDDSISTKLNESAISLPSSSSQMNSVSTTAISETSSSDLFYSFLTLKNDELLLELSSDDIALMLRVLRAAKIRSKVKYSALSCIDLEEIFNEQKPPLHRDIKAGLRAIHKSIVASTTSPTSSSISPTFSVDQNVISKISADNKRLLQKVEELERLGLANKASAASDDTNTSRDVVVGGGGDGRRGGVLSQALMQSKSKESNSKASSKNNESSMNFIMGGLQFTQSHEEQIALLTREVIQLKEEMGINTPSSSSFSSLSTSAASKSKEHLEAENRKKFKDECENKSSLFKK